MLHEAAYGEDSPLGASMYAYNLNKLTAEDIMIFRQMNYNAHNITGNFINMRSPVYVYKSTCTYTITFKLTSSSRL